MLKTSSYLIRPEGAPPKFPYTAWTFVLGPTLCGITHNPKIY